MKTTHFGPKAQEQFWCSMCALGTSSLDFCTWLNCALSVVFVQDQTKWSVHWSLTCIYTILCICIYIYIYVLYINILFIHIYIHIYICTCSLYNLYVHIMYMWVKLYNFIKLYKHSGHTLAWNSLVDVLSAETLVSKCS